MKSVVSWPNNIFIATLLFVFLILLSNFLTPVSSFERQKQLVMQNPQSIPAHLALGELFLGVNDIEKARTELMTIRHLPGESQTLYASEINAFEDATATEETLRSQLFDLGVAQDLYPNYRDLLLKRALLSWRVREDTMALNLLTNAKNLDPNGSKVTVVEGTIQLSQ